MKNIKLLWDIIINDEDLSRYSKQIITDMFYNNIQGFYSSEHPKFANLTDMNKKYIFLISQYVKTNCVPTPKLVIGKEVVLDTIQEGNEDTILYKLEQDMEQVKNDVSRLLLEMERMNATMLKIVKEGCSA